MQPLHVVVAVFVASAVAAPIRADAQLEHPAVRAAREQLIPYGPNTLDAIDALGRVIASADRRFDRIDARYLRAVAATDLLLLHHLGEGGARPAEVATALGVSEDMLTSFLNDELTDVATGPYFEQSMDALRAIEVLEGGQPSSWGRQSSRRDVMRVLEVLRRADGPLSALAELGDDPCAGGRCTPPWSYFDEEGRRAVDALRRGGQMLHRLEEHVRAGDDPLAAAVGERLTQLRERLANLEVAPTANWGFLLQTPTVVLEASGETAPPDAVLHVDTTQLRFVPAPRVRLVDGEPVLTAQATTLPMPPRRRAFITAVDEIVSWLRGLDIEGSVALSVHPDVEALTMWQVIASADRAQADLTRLAVVDGHGRLHTRPFRVAEEAPRAGARVFVRLGGYSVQTGSRSVRLPRMHTDRGWEHDRDGLRRAVRRHDRIAFRTMDVAPVALLFDAVFTPDAPVATLVQR